MTLNAVAPIENPALVLRQAQDEGLNSLSSPHGEQPAPAKAGEPRGLGTKPRLQRARGEGRVETQLLDGRTRLHALYQEGAAKIRLPHTHDASLQAC